MPSTTPTTPAHPIDIDLATPLLAGLSPTRFMRRHWQKKPLLARAALPADGAGIDRAALFDLAGRDGVESRLVVRDGERWSMRHGPFARRALPPLQRPGWTLLVQGVDHRLAGAQALLSRFRFLPDARLDDVMVSFASDGGGVGPHVDSYDVFLLQLEGFRRWRIGPARDATLRPGLPLKILAHFEPDAEWLLGPGDMLYLPPGWAHEGVAEGACLTASIGFRSAGRDAFARELLQRLLDAEDPDDAGPLYRDPALQATTEPARIPFALRTFGADAVTRLLADPEALACALGEVLSEPKQGVWFDRGGNEESDGDAESPAASGVRLSAPTRMLYDERFVFINGESFRAAGRDARLMRQLADRRGLPPRAFAALSGEARALVGQWLEAGWLQVGEGSAT